MMSKIRRILWLFVIFCLSTSWVLPALAQDATEEADEDAAEETVVEVSMPPLAELIAGEWNTLVPGGETD